MTLLNSGPGWMPYLRFGWHLTIWHVLHIIRQQLELPGVQGQLQPPLQILDGCDRHVDRCRFNIDESVKHLERGYINVHGCKSF